MVGCHVCGGKLAPLCKNTAAFQQHVQGTVWKGTDVFGLVIFYHLGGFGLVVMMLYPQYGVLSGSQYKKVIYASFKVLQSLSDGIYELWGYDP